MSKINITYFAPCGIKEGVGGSGRLKNMMDILKQLDVNVKLISFISNNKFKIDKEKYSDITTIYYPTLPLIFRIFIMPIMIFFGLKKISKTDIIFTHAPYQLPSISAFIISKIFNKPMIVDHMDIKDPYTPQFIYDAILKNSKIIVISHYLKNDVKINQKKESTYIPIFIDPEKFQIDNLERRKLRKLLKINEEEIVIGYSGSFWYVEGLPFLIKAFKNLTKNNRNIKLILIGGKNVPNSDDVEHIIKELSLENETILIPQQPHELIPKYLSVCDILCSPKIDCEENRAANPIKIYEYMSMGLITISSSIGEVSNVIKDGENGFLVKPGDEKELEKKLEYIINNLDLLKLNIGQNARKEIIDNYSQNIFVKKISKIIEEVKKVN